MKIKRKANINYCLATDKSMSLCPVTVTIDTTAKTTYILLDDFPYGLEGYEKELIEGINSLEGQLQEHNSNATYRGNMVILIFKNLGIAY